MVRQHDKDLIQKKKTQDYEWPTAKNHILICCLLTTDKNKTQMELTAVKINRDIIPNDNIKNKKKKNGTKYVSSCFCYKLVFKGTFNMVGWLELSLQFTSYHSILYSYGLSHILMFSIETIIFLPVKYLNSLSMLVMQQAQTFDKQAN